MNCKLVSNIKTVLESLQYFFCFFVICYIFEEKNIFFNTKKRIFEFAVVSVYIEDRPLGFCDYKSHIWLYWILLNFENGGESGTIRKNLNL